MFTQLNDVLELNVNAIESNKLMVVHETNDDGAFLLHHYISLYLKHNHKVCLITLSQSFSHFSNVALKFGLTLNREKEVGNLQCIKGLKHIGEVLTKLQTEECLLDLTRHKSSHCHSLKSLYQQIQHVIDNFDNKDKILLIIDDLSILLSIGVSPSAIIYFLQYLKHTVQKNADNREVNVLILIHQDEEEEDVEIHQTLAYACQHCDLLLKVESLKTGICSVVDGQISVTKKYPSSGRSEKKKMHYKISDKNVKFFPLGMSSAVL